jgi:hypothetical protein
MKFLNFIFYIFPLRFLSYVTIYEKINEYSEYEEHDDNFIKVAIVGDKAYWVFDNILYQADVLDDEVIKDNAQPVDAFHMKYEEVRELMEVLDEIQDWTE